MILLNPILGFTKGGGNAVNEAVKQVDDELEKGRGYKPELLVRRGNYFWFLARSGDVKQRKNSIAEAIRSAEKAFEKDANILTALNNYIWYVTHEHDKGESITTDIAKSAVDELQDRVAILERKLGKSQYYPLLNTLAEAYYAISQYYKKQGVVDKTKDYSTKAEKFTQRFIEAASDKAKANVRAKLLVP